MQTDLATPRRVVVCEGRGVLSPLPCRHASGTVRSRYSSSDVALLLSSADIRCPVFLSSITVRCRSSSPLRCLFDTVQQRSCPLCLWCRPDAFPAKLIYCPMSLFVIQLSNDVINSRSMSGVSVRCCSLLLLSSAAVLCLCPVSVQVCVAVIAFGQARAVPVLELPWPGPGLSS